mmetsp:Transcript_4382/g.10613  ORF Transcript_4382/g.10613 Transcript_4382/m.10613 type:complete len:155 (-) Transcript_4382:32-496(-)
MPASTYPDLIVKYPPAQRLRAFVRIASGGVTAKRAPTPALAPIVAPADHPRRSASTPNLPAIQAKAKTQTIDPSKGLRSHPIQCGFPPTKKSCYSELELPIAMAQDPKWSSDLHAMSHKMKCDFFMDGIATAAFLPSPTPIACTAGSRKICRTS